MTDTLSPELVAEIRARVADASLTPEIAPCVVNGVRHSGSCASLNTPANHVSRSNCNCGAYRPYAEFYRADIPALLASHEALREKVARIGRDEEGFEIKSYRVEWQVQCGTVDQYGLGFEPYLNWPFATREAAEAFLPNVATEHAHLKGRWIPKDPPHSYVEARIVYIEMPITARATLSAARPDEWNAAIEACQSILRKSIGPNSSRDYVTMVAVMLSEMAALRRPAGEEG